MGPRSNDRGSTGALPYDHVRFSLQWGPDQTIGEVQMKLEEELGIVQLQWGPDQTIGEVSAVN